jgi:hypothetical protein
MGGYHGEDMERVGREQVFMHFFTHDITSVQMIFHKVHQDGMCSDQSNPEYWYNFVKRPWAWELRVIPGAVLLPRIGHVLRGRRPMICPV